LGAHRGLLAEYDAGAVDHFVQVAFAVQRGVDGLVERE
jgi:hypothetical protein